MAVDQESVSKILSVLSHTLRREILHNLSDRGECSFTELMNALNIDTGKLSFHIRSLGAFLEQTPTGRYRLSRAGENAVRLIKELEGWSVEADVVRKASSLPIATFKMRTLAFLIDLSMILAIGILITLPNAIALLTRGAGIFSFDMNIILFVTLFFLWIYSTLLEGFGGQSLGKKITGLKVVRIDGKKLVYDQAAVRNFGKAFLLPFDLLIGMRLNDDRYIRYFDKFAGTTVIDLKRGRSTSIATEKPIPEANPRPQSQSTQQAYEPAGKK
jgi:uncharacterized RDD family membrane protein YckC/DNA-binding transcriptional ArsR family regulator